MIDTDTEASDEEDDPNGHTDEDSEAMNYNNVVTGQLLELGQNDVASPDT